LIPLAKLIGFGCPAVWSISSTTSAFEIMFLSCTLVCQRGQDALRSFFVIAGMGLTGNTYVPLPMRENTNPSASNLA
jgi:hypothetical protein